MFISTSQDKNVILCQGSVALAIFYIACNSLGRCFFCMCEMVNAVAFLQNFNDLNILIHSLKE